MEFWAALAGALVGGLITLLSNVFVLWLQFKQEKKRSRLERLSQHVENLITTGTDFWSVAGQNLKARELRTKILRNSVHVRSELAHVRKAYAADDIITADIENDFFEHLSGGDFDSRTREPDAETADRVGRLGERLWGKLQEISP